MVGVGRADDRARRRLGRPLGAGHELTAELGLPGVPDRDRGQPGEVVVVQVRDQAGLLVVADRRPSRGRAAAWSRRSRCPSGVRRASSTRRCCSSPVRSAACTRPAQRPTADRGVGRPRRTQRPARDSGAGELVAGQQRAGLRDRRPAGFASGASGRTETLSTTASGAAQPQRRAAQPQAPVAVSRTSAYGSPRSASLSWASDAAAVDLDHQGAASRRVGSPIEVDRGVTSARRGRCGPQPLGGRVDA